MKRLIYRFLLTVLVLSAGIPAVAQEFFESDGLYYYIASESDKTVGVLHYQDAPYSGDIIIPSTVQHDGTDYMVTSIGMSAFFACRDLTSVVIPNT